MLPPTISSRKRSISFTLSGLEPPGESDAKRFKSTLVPGMRLLASANPKFSTFSCEWFGAEFQQEVQNAYPTL